MRGNILLVGLDYGFVGNVACELAYDNDKFFLDVNKLLEYSLMDYEKIKIVCGIEYLEREKRKIIKSIKNYENTIINIPYDYLLDEELKHLFKDEYIVYLNLNKDVLKNLNREKESDNNLNLELLVNTELNDFISKIANLTVIVSTNDVSTIVKTVETELKKLGIVGVNNEY